MSGYGEISTYGSLFYKNEDGYDVNLADTPFFRFGLSILRHAVGIKAPSFPSHIGLSLHSNINKPDYGSTGRKHGTTAFTWTVDGITQSDRTTVQSYWDTTLSDGYDNFTIVDHRARLLFEASWNDWQERWTKRNGGTYQIDYNIESPVQWTLPTFGCYPMINNNLINHNLSGDNLTESDGVFVDNDSDSNVLRLNGYALKVTG